MTIQIVRVDLFRASMPLVHEFETSSHRKGSIEHILVRVTDAEGFVGWGESASPTDPYFCYENVETCWLMLERYLVPALLGAKWATPGEARKRPASTGTPSPGRPRTSRAGISTANIWVCRWPAPWEVKRTGSRRVLASVSSRRSMPCSSLYPGTCTKVTAESS